MIIQRVYNQQWNVSNIIIFTLNDILVNMLKMYDRQKINRKQDILLRKKTITAVLNFYCFDA